MFDSYLRANTNFVKTKTDIAFLQREIKNRKQQFGVDVYELMEQLEVDNETSIEDKESQIRLAFDKARKDIAVIQAKIDVKKEEIGDVEASNNKGTFNSIPNQQTGTNHIMTTSHPGDTTEMEHGLQG